MALRRCKLCNVDEHGCDLYICKRCRGRVCFECVGFFHGDYYCKACQDEMDAEMKEIK